MIVKCKLQTSIFCWGTVERKGFNGQGATCEACKSEKKRQIARAYQREHKVEIYKKKKEARIKKRLEKAKNAI